MIDYELFSKIKHLHQNDGLTARQIARELILDVRTVDKWLKETHYRPRRSAQRPSKLDPFKEDIVRMLERHAYTAIQIFQQIREQGFDGQYTIVKEYVGHGIGTEMHEDPKVPNFVSRELLRNDIILKKGMILAVEPMVNMGRASVKTLSDGWTVVTKDRKCSAHFEHTIAVIEGGCDVLTAGEQGT